MKNKIVLLGLIITLAVSLQAQPQNGTYTLTTVAMGKRLDGNAESLYGFDPNNGDYQKWRIEAVVQPAATPNVTNLEASSTKSLANSENVTQKAVQVGEWSQWESALSGSGGGDGAWCSIVYLLIFQNL